MPPKYLDDDSLRRIQAVVLRVESQMQNPPPKNGGAGDYTPQRWLPFRNDSTAAISARNLIKVTGATSNGEITATLPTTVFGRLFGVNGTESVPPNDFGLCTFDGPAEVAYDSGTPAAGEGFGPKPGQGTASIGYPGMTCIGIVDTANKIMLAELETPIVSMLIKTTSATTAGATNTNYKIMAGGTLGSETDSGYTTVPSARTLVAMSSGIWGTVQFLANGWREEPLECG